MNATANLFRLARSLSGAGFALMMAALSPARATDVWTGLLITYTQPGAYDSSDLSTVDQIAGDMWFTRGSGKPPFNAAPPYNETSYDASAGSPQNSEWAFGNISDYASLTYDTWGNVIGGEQGGDLSATLPNHPLVVHIKSDDIYLSMEFSSWTQGGAGFSYQRSTPAVVQPPPMVSITSPAGGAVFAAPASVSITASASVSGGTVTNVAFFASTNHVANSLGAVRAAPFTVTALNLAAGAYSLAAVATAAGISATSSVVNISVVSPIAVSNSVPAVAGGQFSFNYSANAGLTYVVQRSSDLSTWVPVVTNLAAGNPVHFAETAVGSGARYYRVVRQPNP